jgi:hypothetical protein
VPATRPATDNDHLYHTGIQPLDAGLNFMSGMGGAEWQSLKGTGDFLYNNNPIGAAVGLADSTGLVRNVPDFVPDAWRTQKPVVDLGHALATHPGQVWQGARQAASNWWDSLWQGDPDKRAYAWGGTAFNGLVAADGVAGAAGLASKIGSIGRGVDAIDALKATASMPEAAEAENPVTQLGGAYRDVKGIPGYHAHHMPAKSVSPLGEGEGPSIAMTAPDHELTASYGGRAQAQAYRQRQADLIRRGDFRTAQQMDIQDVQNLFGGKYDDAIQQMLKYSRDQGHW